MIDLWTPFEKLRSNIKDWFLQLESELQVMIFVECLLLLSEKLNKIDDSNVGDLLAS